MSDTVPVNFRVLPTERDAWKQQAEKEGVSLTELVRRTMNARLGAERVVTAAEVQESSTGQSKAVDYGNPRVKEDVDRAVAAGQASWITLPGPSFERPRRTETCEHRLPAGTYCRFGCDD